MTSDEKNRLIAEAPEMVARAMKRGWIRMLTYQETQARDFAAQRNTVSKRYQAPDRP